MIKLSIKNDQDFYVKRFILEDNGIIFSKYQKPNKQINETLEFYTQQQYLSKVKAESMAVPP